MSYHQLPLFQSPLGKGQNDAQGNTTDPLVESHDATLFENPQFEHYEEATKIQLFFDLFFVANLTTFTSQHEINDIQKLSSYIGFFCILWFTWCQVTIYDVRFLTDSIFERVAHACHFGVMIGLAVAGPQFDPSNADLETNWSSFQQLSLILMVSRCILFFQYGTTLIFAWKYRTTRIPLLCVMGSLLVSIFIYLGLSFAFFFETSEKAYIAWYVVAVFEVGANIAIAGLWHIVSFKNTHLVERMSELTLIVLGEGVIGLTTRIAKIESLDFNFSPSAIGSIISAVLIIYLTYQLYFDNVQLEHFGTIRQQIWAFLHFPFHLAIVLFMEGTNQFVIWRHIIENVNEQFFAWDNVNDNTTAVQFYNILNDTIISVFANFNPAGDDPDEVFNEVFEALDVFNVTANPNITDTQASNASSVIAKALYKSIFDGYGFEPPEDFDDENETLDEINDKYFKIFDLVFSYFFICAGVVLMLIAVLSTLSLMKDSAAKTPEKRRRYVGIGANFVLGLSMTLLATMTLTEAADNFGVTSWTLPLLVFVLFIALILNHIPIGRKQKSQTDKSG